MPKTVSLRTPMTPPTRRAPRRLINLCLCALTLALLACNATSMIPSAQVTPTPSPAPTATAEPPTPTRPALPTTAADESEKRCGDGICDGPETADNCPRDCGAPADAPTPTGEAASLPPVYVTVAGHIEDVPVYTDCEAYPDFREKLLLFADAIAPTGAAVNLQIEYEFFQGVAQCETDAMQTVTDGQNVIDYLVNHYGFEIDPHQEGGWEEGRDNYADVRFLGQQVTPSISDNVGGLVWDDADQFARLAQGEPGRIYPDFTWHPTILTLAVSHDHHLGDFSRDDLASGVWRPKGAGESFWSHDDGGPLIYVGPGEHGNWNDERGWRSTPEFVRAVAEQLEEGDIDRDRMYTASIAVPQSVIFDHQRHRDLLTLLDQLAPLIESGRATYATYAEVVNVWRQDYGARPNVFFLEGVEPPYAAENRTPGPHPGERPPLHVGLSVHLEGYPLGNSQTGYNQEVYTRYSQRILAYSDLANDYDMPLTWETANLIGPSATFEPNVLQQLYERGDGVGIHADLGGNPNLSGDQEAFTFQLRKLRADMEAMGIPVVHASGICSELDWVTAAREAGIEATTGVVNYCLRSLPPEQQPPEVQACEGPGDGACHDPYPGDFPEALRPWRATDGATWTTPAEEGLLIVPTLGTIHGLYEATLPDGAPTHNEMTQEDVDVALRLVEEALAARAEAPTPGQPDAFFFVWSLGQAIDEQLLHDFFEGLKNYVDRGDVVWQTMPELIETYRASE